MALPAECERVFRLEALARRVFQLSECAAAIRNQPQYDMLADEARLIANELDREFRG